MTIKVMKTEEVEFELPVPSFFKHREEDTVLGIFKENLIFISAHRHVTSVQIERIRQDVEYLPSSTITRMLTLPQFEKATREDFDRVMNLMFEHTRETSHEHEEYKPTDVDIKSVTILNPATGEVKTYKGGEQ